MRGRKGQPAKDDQKDPSPPFAHPSLPKYCIATVMDRGARARWPEPEKKKGLWRRATNQPVWPVL